MADDLQSYGAEPELLVLETCGLALADGRPEDIWAAYSETGGFAATSEPVTGSVVARSAVTTEESGRSTAWLTDLGCTRLQCTYACST